MGSKPNPERRGGRAFAGLERAVFRALVRTSELLQGDLDGLVSAHGLTASQFDALEALRAAGEDGLSGTALAARMLSRAPDATRLLDRLEGQGLVERARSAEDRRVVVARLTAAGRSAVAALDEPVRGLHREQLGHLSPTALKQLHQLLERVGAGGIAEDEDGKDA